MTSPIDERLQLALGDRYRVTREINRGGMGTIFEAEDMKHRRSVAIKVLNPELSEVIGTRRFQAEVEMAARLMHPHIVPLHDSGEAQGLLYYVMPLVTGESLRQRLVREKQLPLEDAVRIAREVADALHYAHGQGLVHRDVKPENIVLSSGHALVLDFGVAQSTGTGAEAATRTLAVLGTPLYMSPEQSSGGVVDPRSDQYSLACVLYEMLAGQTPFTGGTSDSIGLQHRTVEPRPVTAIRPSVPPPVAAVLSRALAKAPADRYPNAAQFGEALAPFATPALAATPGSVRRDATTPGRQGGGRVMLAVLPLENMSADPEQEFFTDGMTEELIAHLGRLQPKRLGVIARTSAMRYKKTGKSVEEIGRELGVDHVLEGSVRRAGERLRITVQLIQAADQTHLWAENYDRRMADVFDIQSEVAASVAKALEVQLLPSGMAAGSAGRAANPAAYEAYLRGRFHFNRRTGDGFQHAIESFETALALDPSYARAYAGLADVYSVMPGWDFMRREDALPKAEAYAKKALELDPDLAEAHTSYSGVLSNFYGDNVGSSRELARAIELDPSYVLAYSWSASALMSQGRLDDALAMNERAYRMDPQSVVVLVNHQGLYAWKRDFESAITYSQRLLEVEPSLLRHAAFIAVYRAMQGRVAEGIAYLDGMPPQHRQDPHMVAARGYLSAMAGREADAREALRELERRAERGPVPYVAFHMLFAALGESARLYASMEEKIRAGVIAPISLRYSATFDRFRDDPEFQALMERVGA